MIEKKIEFNKRRELGEIISDSFEFIKQEHKPVFKLIITYVLPFLILYSIAQVYFQKNVLGGLDLSDPDSMMANIGPIYLNLFLYSLFGIFVQSLLISALYSYIEMYIKKGKGNFEITEISPNLFANGLLALAASIIWFIFSMFGLLMFIIPGFYFANTFSLLIFILVFEKKGIGDAMSKSWKLVNSQWWNTFLILIIGIVIIWLMGFVLSIPSLVFGVGRDLANPEKLIATDLPLWQWIMLGITSIISSVLWIIPYTFLAFQYFNLAERQKPQSNEM